MNKEITFTNWVRIGDQRVALNDLPKDQQQRIADSLIYRPLTTIADRAVLFGLFVVTAMALGYVLANVPV